MSVCSPEAIAGQPSVWAGVGSANACSNQARVAGLNTPSASTLPGYRAGRIESAGAQPPVHEAHGVVRRYLSAYERISSAAIRTATTIPIVSVTPASARAGVASSRPRAVSRIGSVTGDWYTDRARFTP